MSRSRPKTRLDTKDWYLVAYDVRDEARLRNVAKVLEGFGTRLQYTVFRCRLSDRAREQMRWKLSQVMKPEDGLLIACLCNACIQRLRQSDAHGDWPEDPPAWVTI